MEGKLVEQNYTDEPAKLLLEKIKVEKNKLISENKLKKDKPLSELKPNEILFEVPSNWIWCRLGDITQSSFYGPRFSNSDYVQNGIPTIRTTDMTDDGRIQLKNTPRVSITNEDKLELYKVLDGDLLVTRSGSIGIMAVFRGDYLAIPSAYLIRFRFSQNILPEYVFSLLKSPLWQSMMGLSARATAQVNINATSLSNLPIVLPSLVEQKRIVEKLKKLLTLSNKLEANIRESKTQAEDLLQVALKEALEKNENLAI